MDESRTTANRLGLALGLILVTALPAAAQSWQDMSVVRQRSGEDRIGVHVRYGAGEFDLRPADGNTLYRVNLRYDADQFDPVAAFDDGMLEVGVDARRSSLNVGKGDEGRLDLRLGRDVEMDLELEFGAVQADIDLGGLALASLELRTGASESRVDVSTPNRVPMRRATLEIGAAEFQALRLANLNTERLEVSAGIGSVTLDLSGELRRDLEVEVEMGLGSLELRIPEGTAVRIEKESFLTSFDADGMEKRGDAYYTSNWDDATRRIRVEVNAAFGGIEVVWLR